MNYQFSGPLASSIKRYLEFQRALGKVLDPTHYTLAEFDRYLLEYFPKATTVTRAMVIRYLRSISHVHVNTRSARLSRIRQFSRYLFQIDGKSYIPTGDLLPPRKRTFKPYIYSLRQILALMKSARQLAQKYPLRRESCETLIGLLWTTGLRVGEALRLNLQDVDLVQGLLHIHKSKFHKSRVVPVAKSTVDALRSYVDLRMRLPYDARLSAPFFVCVNGRRWASCTFAKIFRDLLRKNGVRTAITSPRIHDLRHSFATHCLARLYKSDKHPNAQLPILATYMGHAEVSGTALYLHPSIELLRTAGKRFGTHVHKRRRSSLGGWHVR